MDLSNLDEIFRDYDIRGVYPKDFSEERTLAIGRALGTFIQKETSDASFDGGKGVGGKEEDTGDGEGEVGEVVGVGGVGVKKVVVGRDNRKSSPILAEALIKGLLSTGCDVVDVGISLTPIIHFLTCTKDFDLGIEITASHNSKDYNGFRIDYKNAAPFYGDDLQKIKDIVLKKDFIKGRGELKKKDLFADYLNFLKRRFSFTEDVKVAVDCGNGTASDFLPGILKELGCSVVPLYCNSDANYPHDIPDPENKLILKDLKEKVISEGADIGIVLDPDADRFGFVDEKGRNYDTDKTLMIFADDILKEKKGAQVIFDVKATGLLEDFILSRGGVPKRIRTGHPYFYNKMQEGAVLGAEFSGHIYFSDNHSGYDDGIYAACRVIEKLIEKNRPFSYLMTLYPMRVHSTEIKIDCPDNLKFGLIDTLVKNFNEIPSVLDVDQTDGARIKVTDTGWFLIRASNTTPKLSVRVEGLNEVEAKAMVDRVKTVLDPFDFLNTAPLDNVDLYIS